MATNYVPFSDFDITVLQHNTISTDWKSKIKYQLLHGRGYEETCNQLVGYIQYLLSLNGSIIPKRRLTSMGLAFIFPENVIRDEILLSEGARFSWMKVKCRKQDDPKTIIEFMMAKPKNYKKNSDDKYYDVEQYIQYLICTTLNYAFSMDYTFPSNPHIWEGLFNDPKLHSLFNLVYIEDLNFPCLLLPEYLGIREEFNDNKILIRKNDIIELFTQTSIVPYFLSRTQFAEKENIGSGTIGTCKILQKKSDLVLPKCAHLLKNQFVCKAISGVENNSESISDNNESNTPREKLIAEVFALMSVNTIKCPSIVKPCFLKIQDPKDPTVLIDQPLIIYDNIGGKLNLMSTMDYIEGMDISKIPKGTLDNCTKLLIVVQVAEAIYILHENGYVHNDLHSGNIRLKRDSKDVIILDFGICKKLEKQSEQKDIRLFVNVVFELYGIEKKTDENPGFIPDNVPTLLLPLVRDKVFNVKTNSKYKNMSDIIQCFNDEWNGIILERKFLDFGSYLKSQSNNLDALPEIKDLVCNLEKYRTNDEGKTDVNNFDEVYNAFVNLQHPSMRLECQYFKEQGQQMNARKSLIKSSFHY